MSQPALSVNLSKTLLWVQTMFRPVWAHNVLLIVLWLGIWQLGRLVEYTEHASVWFPAAGLTFAALLMGGLAVVPALMFSAVVITFWAGQYYALPLSTNELLIAGFYFGLAHISQYYLGSRIVKWSIHSQRLSVPQLIGVFIIVAAIVSLVATFLVIASLIYTNMMDASMLNSTWLPFWIGDLAGVVVMGPLFIAIFSVLYPNSETSFNQLPEMNYVRASKQFKYKIAGNLVLLVLCMLLAKTADTPEAAFAIFFVSVTHMWIACTESPFHNILSLAISSFAIALLVNVFGLMEHVLVYQFAINVAAANALFGIAIPALVADNRKLKEMVITDALTQVATHGYIKQRGDLEIRKSQKERVPLSMIIFDIDHFKTINDVHGHKVGDSTLKQVCEKARLSLRPTDFLGRYGGDEFVALLPNSTLNEAVEVSQRILGHVNQVMIEDNALGCSFGVAEVATGDDFSALFERADKALYKAKNAGRNRVYATSEVSVSSV